MVFPLPIQALVGLFAFVFLYKRWFSRPTKPEKKEGDGPPEPPGAWPVIGHLHMLGGSDQVYKTISAMADKYGPVFKIRLGMRHTLVVSNWETVKECFTTNDRTLAQHPKSALGKYLGYDYSMIGMAPYGSFWRDLRKITTVHLLSNVRLDALKHIRTEEIDARVKGLYRMWEKNGRCPVKVEMKPWLKDLTFNVVAKMVAGKEFYSANGFEIRRFRDAIDRFFEYAVTFMPSDMIPLVKWMDWMGHKRGMQRLAEELDCMVGSLVEEHRRRRLRGGRQEERDFIDVMLSIVEDGEFSGHDPDKIVKATSLSLILGGTDTTAVSLAVALSFVLNNPHVLKKARDELDIHVGTDRHVDESDIKNLVYLQAIIKESFRLTPVIMFLPLHEAMEDCTIGGFHVPAGTCVLVNVHKIHRDTRVWSDPLEFQPERFLTSHAETDLRGQHFEFVPFGSGRRACSGISFALQVMQLTLARLLHGFELVPASDARIDVERLAIGKRNSPAVEALFSPRLPSQLYE